MSKRLYRTFKKDELIYIIDFIPTNNGTQAYAAQAKVVSVNEDEKTFVAAVNGDIYQTYSFYDYGRLIFNNSTRAIETANILPKPGSTIYQLVDRRIHKRTVTGIGGQNFNGVYDLTIYLDNGKIVPAKELGCTLFDLD